MTVDELVSKGFAASELLDAGVSCDDVERGYGEIKSACRDNTALIVAIVVGVALLGAAVGGVVWFMRHKRPSPTVVKGHRTRRLRCQREAMVVSPMYPTADPLNPNTTDADFDVTTSGLSSSASHSEPTAKSDVFVSGAATYLIPMEGGGSSPGLFYVDPASGQVALCDAATHPRESQAAAYASPCPDLQPTYALPVASTNSIEIYTDATGNAIPTFVEHVDGGYSQIRGGQLYVDTQCSVAVKVGKPIFAVEKDTPAEATEHGDDVTAVFGISIRDQALHYDRPYAVLGGTSVDAAPQVRRASDWNSRSQQIGHCLPLTVPVPRK
jgi:hypothetical protein